MGCLIHKIFIKGFLKGKMMKNLKKTIVMLCVAAMFLFANVSEIFARSRSSRSSFSSRSSSKSTSRSTSRTPTRTTRSTKPSSSKRTTTAPKRTAAQQKSYEAAKRNGTAFKSKSQAQAAFKKANASKYTSKYTTKPATRPSHIPQTTSVGGKTYNVIYNQQYGGYGYMGVSGWIMYDAMTDMAMLSILMSRNNYYYDTTPAVIRTHSRGGGGVLLAIIGVVALAVIVAIIVVAVKNQGTSSY